MKVLHSKIENIYFEGCEQKAEKLEACHILKQYYFVEI